MLQSRRQTQAALGQRALHQGDSMNFGNAARNRDLRYQHVARAVQHLLFAKGERLIDVQLQQSFENLRGFQQVPALHFVAVLLEAELPIGVEGTPPDRQVGENSRDLANSLLSRSEEHTSELQSP